MKSKDIIYRIAEKLDQSEKGYVVPKITYLDNKESILLEYPKGLYLEKFIVTVSKIPKD